LAGENLGAALELRAVNAISVPEQVLRGRCKGENLPELLGSPTSRRAFNDIEVEDSATIM